MTQSERPIRLDALTGLRWWAAFAVFFFHMLVFAPLPGWTTDVFVHGHYGVTFFFVLSGFVLTWSARPGVSTSTFYWRRFARIWPAHMAALLIAIPVFYTVDPIPEGSFLKPLDLGVLLLSVVLLQAWFSQPTILFSGNPAAWTLTVEALFYALHPWISRPLQKLSGSAALVCFGLGSLVVAFGYRFAVVQWPDGWLGDVPVPVQRVPEFVLGMALAWAFRSGWRPRVHPLVGIAAMALVIGGLVVAGRRPDAPVLGRLLPYSNELFTVSCAVAIVSLASWTLAGRRSLFASSWQVKLGEWSFAFYLVHATLIYIALRIWGFQDPAWSNVFWFGVLAAAGILAAWALHAMIERPLEKRMRSWKDRRDARRTATA